MKKKAKGEKHELSIMAEAAAYLESWGRCPDLDAEARLIGRMGSALREKRGGHCGIEAVAAQVETALQMLGDDAHHLAVLLYRHGHTNAVAAARMGISPITLEKRLACLKVAAFVMVASAKNTSAE
jgi:hypothetical protein